MAFTLAVELGYPMRLAENISCLDEVDRYFMAGLKLQNGKLKQPNIRKVRQAFWHRDGLRP